MFVLATNNPHKVIEMKRILSPLGIDAVTQKEAGIGIDVEETGLTFEENAFLKAQAISIASGKPAIADDSGLCVDALDGRPGVFSARYAETNEERIAKLLGELEGKTNRNAKFVSAICCYFSEDDYFCVRGECLGKILTEAKGQEGFGYDPVFVPLGEELTFAEMTAEMKDKFSHRGKSLEALKNKLEERIKL